MELSDAIRNRRTEKAFLPNPVARPLLEEILDLARWAPNHKLTNPWRFRVVGPRALDRLKAADPPSATKLDRAPTLVVCSCVPSQQDEALAAEDLHATACAAYIVLLAAHERGLASYWRTPDVLRSEAGRSAVEMTDEEVFVGLIYLGEPAGSRPPAPARESLESIVTYLE